MREGRGTKQDFIREKVLNNALSKLPDYEGTVFRGVKITDTDKFLKDYAKGGEINFNQFVSTSFSKTERYYGNVEYTILSKSGKDVSKLSFKPHEKEILFGTSTKFSVFRLETKENKIYITLEEK